MSHIKGSKKLWNDVVFLHNVAKTIFCTWYALHVLLEKVVSQWHQAERYTFKMSFQELLMLMLEFLQ